MSGSGTERDGRTGTPERVWVERGVPGPGEATEGTRGPDDPSGERGVAPELPRWLSPRAWVLGLGLVAGGLSISGVVDGPAQASADRVFQQALLTFAAARTLDAAVSLAEGTEIAIQPGGLGVTVSAGEVLEPIDQLVEQFSSVMLVSATSLGVQSLLLRASAWGVVTWLLVLFLVARVAAAFFPDRFHPSVRHWIAVASSVLLICRFAMPVYALATTALFEHFLQPSQAEAVQAIEETSGDIREIDQLTAVQVEEGWKGRVSAWFSGTVERLDVPERVAAFRDRVSTAVEHLMHLLVVFVLQTILLPLTFLWALPKAVKLLVARSR